MTKVNKMFTLDDLEWKQFEVLVNPGDRSNIIEQFVKTYNHSHLGEGEKVIRPSDELNIEIEKLSKDLKDQIHKLSILKGERDRALKVEYEEEQNNKKELQRIHRSIRNSSSASDAADLM